MWEIVGIRQKKQLQHKLYSLKLNFKYQFQGQLNSLYASYKSRRDTNSFETAFLFSNMIVREGNNIKVLLKI